MRLSSALRTVALLEAAKGALVLNLAIVAFMLYCVFHAIGGKRA
jgi:hypothetical protein